MVSGSRIAHWGGALRRHGRARPRGSAGGSRPRAVGRGERGPARGRMDGLPRCRLRPEEPRAPTRNPQGPPHRSARGERVGDPPAPPFRGIDGSPSERGGRGAGGRPLGDGPLTCPRHSGAAHGPGRALCGVRQAATGSNDDGRYQGQGDPDLAIRGVSQAKALARRLTVQRAVFDSIWASDRRRAWHTAALAVPRARVRQDARLRELDFGVFDGRTYEENLARYPQRFPAWLADPWTVRPPLRETLAELATRIESWLAQLAPGQNGLAFTHGGPMRVTPARALGVSLAQARRVPVAPRALMP